MAAWAATRDEVVFGDEDGVLVVAADEVDRVLTLAEGIRDTEGRQAALIRTGTSLRDQVAFGPSAEFSAFLTALASLEPDARTT